MLSMEMWTELKLVDAVLAINQKFRVLRIVCIQFVNTFFDRDKGVSHVQGDHASDLFAIPLSPLLYSFSSVFDKHILHAFAYCSNPEPIIPSIIDV